MSRIPDYIREQVKKRARNRCEYCDLPNVISLNDFHVEHIRPRKHRGTDSLDNLAWSCPSCNFCKGTDFASYDEDTDELTLLFDPRTDEWGDHFDMVEAIIIGKTAMGRVTVFLLQFNHRRMVNTRRFLLDNEMW